MKPALLAGVLVSFTASPLSAIVTGDGWPQYRGENGNGAVGAAKVPLEWSESKNVAWKVAIPGAGWSQPVVVGDLVFVTTAVGKGLERPMGMKAGIDDPRTNAAGAVPDAELDWQLQALDLATGAVRWTTSVVKGKPKFPIHPSNTYATETAAADANGVYVFFGVTGTAAGFDHKGKQLWKAEFGAHPTVNGYGPASSPALYDGKLFVQCFNDDEAFLACLDTKTGKELWRAKREEAGTSWCSPLAWHNGKRVEIVASGSRLITSHDPATGKELWRAGGIAVPTMCSFGADSERLYFGQVDPGSNPPLYAMAAGASGDQSPEKGKTELRSQVWAQRAASPGMPSPVVADGLLYIASENLLTCRDAESGDQLYKERVPELKTIAASPIIIGDKVLLLDEEGGAAFVPLGPEFEVVGRGKLDDMFWSTPSVAGTALLLRGVDHLYCVRQ